MVVKKGAFDEAYVVKAVQIEDSKYAVTQLNVVDSGSGESKRYYLYWGNIIDECKFIPNIRFKMASLEEKSRLIFPENWDISVANEIRGNMLTQKNLLGEGKSISLLGEDDQIQNQLVGKAWFLWKIAEKNQIISDLMKGLDFSLSEAYDLLSLAMYEVSTREGFDKIETWKSSSKLPSTGSLDKSSIDKLIRKITKLKKFSFFKKRVSKQESTNFIACENVIHLTVGKGHLGVNWNEEDEIKTKDLRCIVVYSRDTLEPVYFNTFELTKGNINIRVKVMEELGGLGYKDPKVFFVQKFETNENVDEMIRRKLAIHVYENIESDLSLSFVKCISFGPGCKPLNMEYLEREKVYAEQFIWKKSVRLDPNLDEEHDIKMRLNLFLDNVNRADKLERVNDNIRKGDAEISNYIVSKTKVTAKDVKSLSKKYPYHEIWLDPKTKKLLFKLNNEKIEKLKLTAGFFSSISYKTRSSIEEDFAYHMLRNAQDRFFEKNKEMLCFGGQMEELEKELEGKLFVLYMTLYLYAELYRVWYQNLNEKYYSPLGILDKMSTVNEFGKGSNFIEFDNEQKEICELFDLQTSQNDN